MPLKISGSDVKVATATGDATIVNHPARLRQIYVLTSTGSPKIVFKNGGASGTTLWTQDLKASSESNINVPDQGIYFGTDIYVDVTAISYLTVFHS